MTDNEQQEHPAATPRASEAGKEAQPAESPAATPTPTPRAASPTSAIVRSLVRSVTPLHHAWSRALMTDDVAAARQQTLSLWQALLVAIATATSEREGRMGERGAAVLTTGIPPQENDLVTLLEDQSEAAALHWLQVAYLMSVMGLTVAMRSIDAPSIEVTTFGTQQGGMSTEEFFDAGGLELLRSRAELVGRIEDELDAALDDSARAPLSQSWTNELDTALSLVSGGCHDSALAHLIIALKLLVYWAVPEAATVVTPFEELLEACPSLRQLAVVVRRAQLIVHNMGDGEPAPLSQAVPIAEVLAASIGRLTVTLPRYEVLAAVEESRRQWTEL
jgi:hypothetical protein